MSLKLSITSSRKIGQPNFGSRGAVVGLELEVDPNLLERLPQLHRRIAKLFAVAKHAVDRELTLAKRDALNSPESDTASVPARLATVRQVRALFAIANRHAIDLHAELQTRLGVSRPEELTRDQASGLISALSSFNQRSAAPDKPVQVTLQGSA